MANEKSIDPAIQKRFETLSKKAQAKSVGVGGGPMVEAFPKYIRAECEKIIEGQNNTLIILGRDRPASRMSGYGGLGDPGAGSIDIVAGLSGRLTNGFDKDGKKLFADPSMNLDAARVLLSQKTNVDENFGLAKGVVGDRRAKSAVAIKADEVRVMSRGGIKLVTRVGTGNDSQNQDNSVVYGVDIIAGNDDKDLQSMVKGRNLVDALTEIYDNIDALSATVDGLLMFQMEMNGALISHTHFSPFYALPTSPSPNVMTTGIKTAINHLSQTKRSLFVNRTNMVMAKMRYLSQTGENFICSRYNNVN